MEIITIKNKTTYTMDPNKYYLLINLGGLWIDSSHTYPAEPQTWLPIFPSQYNIKASFPKMPAVVVKGYEKMSFYGG
jgi:hypothetical protein